MRARASIPPSWHSASCSSSFSSTASAAPASAAASSPTPAELGFRMPGEYERHAGTWMAFPYNPTFWRDGARPGQAQMAALATAISQFEQVWMLADPQVAEVARSHFRSVSGVEVVEIPTNDIWIRDWGPTCIVRDDPASGRREMAAVRWDYNCYGAPVKMAAGLPVLMSDWSKDRAAGRSLPSRHGLRPFDCALHLEGGSVHSDGQGTLLATEECLLHPSRNPGLSRTQIESQLCAQLGASKVLWLPRGMAGDEEGTNGHVDNVACFAEPGTVLLAWSEHPDDPQTSVAAQNLAALQVPCPEPPVVSSLADVTGLAARAAGTGYAKVFTLEAGMRLPGSYLNHYIVNGGVVVPQFGGAQSRSDASALEVLAAAYPDRKVIGVLTRELLLNGGNIHCLTQQLPAEGPTGLAGRGGV
ncbi:hypothetical protein GPECTOR_3g104 [Gonium pectorale]|uniref:Agmatine deiminase n=1 Tax=Gonium pectorale TaxID=33097 RepID=A0A150GYQ8_GONPE|nr:hypothetical protein GPECTOR_3g104 [Gonium pectorale]|eukprot:KXZ54934.1 hypothetical protein GPECTOR_3g104 [Gonium pectorale]